jgi:hypothetical protein
VTEADSPTLRLAGGGSALILENSGEQVVLQSSHASPPGSTLQLDHQGLAVMIKVRGCKRSSEGERPFRIEGRLVSLTRAAREQLFGSKSNAP